MDIRLTVPDSIFTIWAQHSQNRAKCVDSECMGQPSTRYLRLQLSSFSSRLHKFPRLFYCSCLYGYENMNISINLKTEHHQISGCFTKEDLNEYLALCCFSSLEQIAQYIAFIVIAHQEVKAVPFRAPLGQKPWNSWISSF